ncbi:class I adenylate-forming enzyme family protein [Modestobacter sp. I12A-02662]|uniref:class I adenylate-forming enzyme family protein n=1 Tax=Modestobacter sp. I12A-02662 TaxID=1730496 RepID=UPI0034DF341F
MTDLPSSVPAALEHWAVTTPDAAALTGDWGADSYRELREQVLRAVSRLHRAGVRRGDRVVVAGGNTRWWVYAHLATLRLGAVSVPTNTRLSPAQFGEHAAALGASVVLVDEERRRLAAEVRTAPVLDLAGADDGPVAAELPPIAEVCAPDAPALISSTSGTTGRPKGAVISHGALWACARTFAEQLGLGADDSTRVLVPLFHNTGFVDQLATMLAVGGRTDLLEEFHTRDAVAAFEELGSTYLTAVPSIIRLLMVADGADAVFSGVRTVLYGGSPMPAAWSAELRRRWPRMRLVHGYGLTEFTSVVTLLPPDQVEARGESIGRPVPDVDVRIVDDGGAEVDPGRVGELWVRGATRMTGYWDDPEATAAKLSGGWLRTGDLARCDAEGWLHVEGRLDDVINRGGEKVLPASVESVLATCPEVAQASVFALPHPILQHRVLAALEVRPGREFDERSTRARLGARLPDYAIPEEFIVMQHLPRTASGKVDRRAVAAAVRAAAGADR